MDLQLPFADVRPTKVPDQADPLARTNAIARTALLAQFPRRLRRAALDEQKRARAAFFQGLLPALPRGPFRMPGGLAACGKAELSLSLAGGRALCTAGLTDHPGAAARDEHGLEAGTEGAS